MKKQRFSKQKMLDYISSWMKILEDQHGFESGMGYQQVEGKDEKVNRAYGGYDMLNTIYEDVSQDCID